MANVGGCCQLSIYSGQEEDDDDDDDNATTSSSSSSSRGEGGNDLSVGDDLLGACRVAWSRDYLLVLIVAFPASGLGLNPPPPLERTPFLANVNISIALVNNVTEQALAFE